MIAKVLPGRAGACLLRFCLVGLGQNRARGMFAKVLLGRSGA